MNTLGKFTIIKTQILLTTIVTFLWAKVCKLCKMTNIKM